jgi:hypothetical protein
MTVAKTVTATFNIGTIYYSLSVSKSGIGTGVVTSSPSGINCGSSCTASYTSGTFVMLTASANPGSTFTGWSGACSGTESCTVSMTAAKSVIATFNTSGGTTYSLSVSKSGTGTGVVTSSPSGINCGSSCTASYTSGTFVMLTASANPGSTFTGWSGACSGTESCTVSMTAAKSVIATFNTSGGTTYSLSVSKSGTGTGVVTSSPSGISCGCNCTASYTSGTSVTLSASPDPGSTFTGWSGGGCSGTRDCQVTMDGDKNITATFELTVVSNYILSVTKTGLGTVTSSPSGINCGSSCTASYTSGTSVTLSASPDPGSTFTGWSGACTGTVSTCTVIMNSSKDIGAQFTTSSTSSVLTVTFGGTGEGVVNSNPGTYINCSSDRSYTDCTETFTKGASVTIIATAGLANTFAGWSGACTGTNTSCTISMTEDKNAIATFNPMGTHTLTILKTGTGTGKVTAPFIDCGSTCTMNYYDGAPANLTATPDVNSTFANWSGDCTGSTCALIMNSDKRVTATFNATTTPPVVFSPMLLPECAQSGLTTGVWAKHNSNFWLTSNMCKMGTTCRHE